MALLEFEPVLLIGITGDGYLITNELDEWNEFVNVDFIRNDTGVKLLKIHLIR